MTDEMLWGCFIAFGVFGLMEQWGNVFWLFVVIGVMGFVASMMKGANERGSNRPSLRVEPEMQEKREITIPDDAHDAVEAFAKLVHRTYVILDQVYTREKNWYQAEIKFRFGEDDTSSHAEFNFHFDWNMEDFYEQHGYTLGRGFSVDGENVCYKSDTVQNLYSWIGAATIKMRNSGGEFDLHLAMALADDIVATFVNNCPSAYVEYKSPREEKFVVFFRFR